MNVLTDNQWVRVPTLGLSVGLVLWLSLISGYARHQSLSRRGSEAPQAEAVTRGGRVRDSFHISQ